MPTRAIPREEPATGARARSRAAEAAQVELARAQGATYGAAVDHLIMSIARDGAQARAGALLIAFALREAQPTYEYVGDTLTRRDPGDTDVHVAITVRHALDGRLVAGAKVWVSFLDAQGARLGPQEHPLVWHPLINHYGRSWALDDGGPYTLRVRVEPPPFVGRAGGLDAGLGGAAEVQFDRVWVGLPGRRPR